jgi:hypothetical protein
LCASASPPFFGISRNTINLWLRCKAETGDFQPKSNKPAGNGHKITDWQKFREFTKVNGDKTQEQMAQLWEGDIAFAPSAAPATESAAREKKDLWVQTTFANVSMNLIVCAMRWSIS